NLDLQETLATVAHGRPNTVCAGVAAADDDYVLIPGVDEVSVAMIVEHRLGVGVQEFHREMNALQITAFDWQIARLGGARREDHRIKFLEKICSRIIFPNFGVGHE